MKILIASLLLSATAFGQSADNAKIITFNRADTEHCGVVVVEGKPLLQSTYEGTRVAIGMPQNLQGGEFAVFVYVYQVASGSVKVAPKEFFAVYSDAAHTRFPYYDKESELEMNARAKAVAAGQSGANSQLDMGMLGRDAGGAGDRGAPDGTPNSGKDATAGAQSPGAAGPLVFLRKTTLKQGAGAAGLVFFRKPKGAKIRVSPSDMLDQIDIAVNGVVFRF